MRFVRHVLVTDYRKVRGWSGLYLLNLLLNLTENRSTDSKGERWEHTDTEKTKIPRKKVGARTHAHTHRAWESQGPIFLP